MRPPDPLRGRRGGVPAADRAAAREPAVARALSLRVAPAGADRLGELEPLWRSLHAAHSAIAQGVAPVRPVEDSWRHRRAQYEEWLADGSATLLLAERDGRGVGYAMVRQGGGAATWDLGDVVVELETLSVLESERGEGVGRALVAAARDEARRRGAGSLLVALAHTNDGARRFYEREGFHPFYVSMVMPI